MNKYRAIIDQLDAACSALEEADARIPVNKPIPADAAGRCAGAPARDVLGEV